MSAIPFELGRLSWKIPFLEKKDWVTAPVRLPVKPTAFELPPTGPAELEANEKAVSHYRPDLASTLQDRRQVRKLVVELVELGTLTNGQITELARRDVESAVSLNRAGLLTQDEGREYACYFKNYLSLGALNEEQITQIEDSGVKISGSQPVDGELKSLLTIKYLGTLNAAEKRQMWPDLVLAWQRGELSHNDEKALVKVGVLKQIFTRPAVPSAKEFVANLMQKESALEDILSLHFPFEKHLKKLLKGRSASSEAIKVARINADQYIKEYFSDWFGLRNDSTIRLSGAADHWQSILNDHLEPIASGKVLYDPSNRETRDLLKFLGSLELLHIGGKESKLARFLRNSFLNRVYPETENGQRANPVEVGDSENNLHILLRHEVFSVYDRLAANGSRVAPDRMRALRFGIAVGSVLGVIALWQAFAENKISLSYLEEHVHTSLDQAWLVARNAISPSSFPAKRAEKNAKLTKQVDYVGAAEEYISNPNNSGALNHAIDSVIDVIALGSKLVRSESASQVSASVENSESPVRQTVKIRENIIGENGRFFEATYEVNSPVEVLRRGKVYALCPDVRSYGGLAVYSFTENGIRYYTDFFTPKLDPKDVYNVSPVELRGQNSIGGEILVSQGPESKKWINLEYYQFQDGEKISFSAENIYFEQSGEKFDVFGISSEEVNGKRQLVHLALIDGDGGVIIRNSHRVQDNKGGYLWEGQALTSSSLIEVKSLLYDSRDLRQPSGIVVREGVIATPETVGGETLYKVKPKKAGERVMIDVPSLARPAGANWNRPYENLFGIPNYPGMSAAWAALGNGGDPAPGDPGPKIFENTKHYVDASTIFFNNKGEVVGINTDAAVTGPNVWIKHDNQGRFYNVVKTSTNIRELWFELGKNSEASAIPQYLMIQDEGQEVFVGFVSQIEGKYYYAEPSSGPSAPRNYYAYNPENQSLIIFKLP